MFFKAMFVECICVVVSVIMQQVEEQEQRHSEDSVCSPKEREKAKVRGRIAHFFANAFPKIGTAFVILYIVAFAVTGGNV